MLTVACVYWKGSFRGRERIFNTDYILRLKNMVARNLSIPHKFVCLSNTQVPCERIPLKHNFPGYWSKIELFRPGLFEDRVLYLDLDTVVLGDLSPVVNFPSKMAIMDNKQAKTRRREGKLLIGLYNSSVMVFDSGEGDILYNLFQESFINRYWGDQDWIGMLKPDLDTFPREWIKKVKTCEVEKPDPELKIALCMMGSLGKNEAAAAKYNWVKEAWI